MNGIEKIAEKTRALVLTLSRMIDSARSVVASAFVAALIVAPCYTMAAAAGEADTLASTTSAPAKQSVASEDARIRPFRVNVPMADLTDLRRRLAATRWPTKELVKDRSQGVQLATLKELVRYWATDYDWRKAETKLNAFPQFVTKIDGVDIHFIHVKSRHPNALPLIITHGWPGSVIELFEVIDPLTNPTAHGGSAEDAFQVVIP